MLLAGTEGGAISRPIRLPIQIASGGRNRGALRRRAASSRTAAPTSNGWPRSSAPVTMTMAVPVARLTTCMITDDPAAAIADSPRFLAITPIAVSDHTFPGTYFPMLDMNQIRAASMNGTWESQASSTRRQPSMRSAYVMRISAVAAASHSHPNWIWVSLDSTLFHCVASECAAVLFFAAQSLATQWNKVESRLNNIQFGR